ncbi:Lcl domain-containing protein [Winogradskyella wichelsiae]|nr:DUF1566 domain-containing protein [Winogradskyella wichelsiae]
MKKFYTILAAVLLTLSTFAQTPEKMSYQAVVRDSGDNLVANQPIGMQISILQTTATGTAVYVETQTPTTNINGLVTLEIGTGSVVSGDFATIDWSADTYFIKTETDPTGGSSYTITGTSQLMSVPYALYAKTSGSSTPGPTGLQGPSGNDGADGSDGADGTNGLDGATGATGSTGPQGAQGPTGNDGADGADGADGTNGLDGATGATGSTGPQGAQGPTGNDGADGADGAAGTDGTDGATGATGLQGLQGPAGNDGADGVGIAQTLSFTSPNLTLSDSGGTVDLTSLINDADSDISNEIQNLSEVLTEGNTADAQIKNVTDPTDAQDAATKAYVDALEAQIAALDARITTLEPATIGDFRNGGVVFWVDPTDNTHGLVCAIEDQSSVIPWNNGSYIVTGATGTAVGTGAANTATIITAQGATETDYAAGLARAYTGGGFNDWFLPSQDELNEMYLNKAAIEATATANSGAVFYNDYYWSSSEVNNSYAWYQSFADGNKLGFFKYISYYVRAVRAF